MAFRPIRRQAARSAGCLSPRPPRAEEADSRNKAADCPDGARALKEELWRPVSRQRRTHRLRSCDGSELKFPRHDVPTLHNLPIKAPLLSIDRANSAKRHNLRGI